jgi:DNA helicase-2/ATP-dependent DNA helicase PcrA
MASRFLRELPEDEILKKGGYAAPQYSAGYSQEFGYRPKPVTSENTWAARTASAVASSATKSVTMLDLNKGDMVNHTAFGKGMVLSVIKMGGDALWEIAFDQIGTKKLMAKTASAHMKKLS